MNAEVRLLLSILALAAGAAAVTIALMLLRTTVG